jgi:RNA polymerase sigma factor (sigma-70 family)
LDTVEHPNAWIRLVVRRKVWAIRRRSSLHRNFEGQQFAHERELGEDDFDSLECLLDMKAALFALGETERYAVVRRDVEGASLSTIADSSGLSLKTIKRRLKRGRQRLNRALEGRSVLTNFHPLRQSTLPLQQSTFPLHLVPGVQADSSPVA